MPTKFFGSPQTSPTYSKVSLHGGWGGSNSSFEELSLQLRLFLSSQDDRGRPNSNGPGQEVTNEQMVENPGFRLLACLTAKLVYWIKGLWDFHRVCISSAGLPMTVESLDTP